MADTFCRRSHFECVPPDSGRRRRMFLFPVWLVLAVSSGCGFLESAQVHESTVPVRRLILIDGSFEAISQHSVREDRVRYFSTERYAWEELPSSLVDWSATERYAREAAAGFSARKDEQLVEEAMEKRENDSRHPEVAPGLRLGLAEGIYMLNELKGRPELVELVQHEADLVKNTRGNILRGIFNPVASSRQTAEIKGLNARMKSHVPEPVFYVPVRDSDSRRASTADSAKDRFRIVRCEQKKGNRILAVYKIAITGKVEQQTQNIQTRVESVSEHWLKITPTIPVEPGEYALVELDEKGSMNLFVADFGFDSDAPPNPAIGVEIPERREPVLILKPQKKAIP